jgi:phospholipid transport system substrate-binding protein
MRQRLDLTLAVGLALAGASLQSAPVPAQAALSSPETEARSFVQTTIDQVLTILRNPALPQQKKKDDVEQIAYDRFDFQLISRLVLAQNWNKLSPKQQADFVDAFKQHLSATYRDTLDNFRDEKITIESSRLEPKGDVTVMTLVHGAADNTKVDYRLRRLPEGWRGIDVIVEGVSLVQNFRSQTQEIISNEGADVLIQRLRDKQIKDVAPKGKA